MILRLRADAGHIPLADGSVHLVCTSPPYANLRRYDDPAQVRKWSDGTRHALGNEPDPGLYIAHLVECFREVQRVLRSDGVCAVVIGDSYGRGKRPAWKGDANRGANRRKAWVGYAEGAVSAESEAQDGNLLLIPYRFALAMQAGGWTLRSETIWAKALSFCPAYSGSTMPESVAGWRFQRCRVRAAGASTGRDGLDGSGRRPHGATVSEAARAEWTDCPGCARCAPNGGFVLRRGSWRATRGHEAIFVFAKSGRYYGDGIAVEERASASSLARISQPTFAAQHGGAKDYGRGTNPNRSARRALENFAANGGATRNLRDVWAISPTPFSGAKLTGGKAEHYACVDADTEILTVAGWRGHSTLLPGVLVAAYDKDKHVLRWEPLISVHRYEHEGNLYELGGRELGMRCTADHRCLVRRYQLRERHGAVHVRLARELVRGLEVPCIAPWEPGTFLALDDPGPALAEVIGWVVTDGWVQDTSVAISQSLTANRENVDRIRQRLKDAGLVFREFRRNRGAHKLPNGAMCKPSVEITFTITGRQSRALASLIGRGKVIPRASLLWSEASIRAMLDGIRLGDGHTRRADGRIMISQKSREFIDMVQALYVRLGLRCLVSRLKGGMWVAFVTTHRPWHGLRATNGVRSAIQMVPYAGVVWCPEVPSGFFLCRRNGRLWITGNSFPEAIVEPLLRAYTSARGVCRACSAPWARVVERMGESTRAKLGEHGPSDYANAQPIAAQGLDYAGGHGDNSRRSRTLDWRATCACDAGEPVPATVLDCFAGTGTVGAVAVRLRRRAVLCDLSQSYLREIADARTRNVQVELPL